MAQIKSENYYLKMFGLKLYLNTPKAQIRSLSSNFKDLIKKKYFMGYYVLVNSSYSPSIAIRVSDPGIFHLQVVSMKS